MKIREEALEKLKNFREVHISVSIDDVGDRNTYMRGLSNWDLTIKNAISLLKPDGLFLFTCATVGRPEHGTKRTSPYASPFTSQLENDYYKNLTEEDVRSKIDIDSNFSKYQFLSNTSSFPQDLYFWGIKQRF